MHVTYGIILRERIDFSRIVKSTVATELVHFAASLTGGVNNQPVAYSDIDDVNKIFVAF